MAELGEVPEAAVEALADFLLDADGDMASVATRGLKAACDPALGDQRLVPASAVADAVRAERERVARALDAANFKPRRLRVDDGAGPPYDVRYQAPAEFVRALPPADGNTEEEG